MSTQSLSITTYKDGYIQDQVNLGKEITKNWKYYEQSSISSIKKKYSNPEFDPTTRFYLFDNEEMIGFLTCRIEDGTAYMSPPIVKSDDYSYIEMLVTHAVDTFTKRQVNKIRITLSKDWGSGYRLVEKYNLSYSQFLFREYRGKLRATYKRLRTSSKNEAKVIVENYDQTLHIDSVSRILSSIIGYDIEVAKSILNQPNPMPGLENTISLVLTFNDTIIGWIRGSIINDEQRYISLSPGYIENNQYYKYRLILISTLFEEAIKLGIEDYRLIITQSTRSQFNPDLFTENHEKKVDIAYYMKDIA